MYFEHLLNAFPVNIPTYFLCIVILGFLLIRAHFEIYKSNYMTSYAVMCVAMLMYIFFDMVTSSSMTYDLPINRYYGQFIYGFRFITIIIVSYSLFLCYIKKSYRFIYAHKEYMMLYSLPCVIGIIINLVNSFCPFMFVVNDNEFEIMRLYAIEYIPILFYIISIPGVDFKNSKRINQNREGYIGVHWGAAIMIASHIIQNLFAPLPIVTSTMTVVIVLATMYTLDKRIVTDPLTHVNNRNDLISEINRKINNKMHDNSLEIYAIMIDIDGFKHINDTYGHLEGDEALIDVAESIKENCNMLPNHPFVARYGGDEFIIITEAPDLQKIKELIKCIRLTINKKLVEYNAPYSKINLSVGIAPFIDYMTPEKLIKAADDALYEVKAIKKKAVVEQ